MPAQSSSVLTALTPRLTLAKRGGLLTGKVSVALRNGYHVNSNTPNDEYLIPLRLSWRAEPLRVVDVIFPKPELRDYSFSAEPVSVFTGEFDIVTRFKIPSSAPLGPAVLIGKLRYQACSDTTCLPPKSIEVKLPIHIQAK